MKKLALLGTIGLAAGGALVVSHKKGHAADHLDGPNVSMAANKLADINDVFTWMDSGGEKINLAMTVSPADDGTHPFGPSVQYVFHTTSRAGDTNTAALSPTAATTAGKVICTFASATSGQCWILSGTTVVDYVKGDFSSTSGVTSADGKVKVFAGRRSDPFYFNLGGFKAAIGYLETKTPTSVTTSGCPTYAVADRTVAGADLVTAQAIAPCTAADKDCFSTFNAMAIVLQVDKTLLLHGTDHLLGVWGSTHAAQ